MHPCRMAVLGTRWGQQDPCCSQSWSRMMLDYSTSTKDQVFRLLTCAIKVFRASRRPWAAASWSGDRSAQQSETHIKLRVKVRSLLPPACSCARALWEEVWRKGRGAGTTHQVLRSATRRVTSHRGYSPWAWSGSTDHLSGFRGQFS